MLLSPRDMRLHESSGDSHLLPNRSPPLWNDGENTSIFPSSLFLSIVLPIVAEKQPHHREAPLAQNPTCMCCSKGNFLTGCVTLSLILEVLLVTNRWTGILERNSPSRSSQEQEACQLHEFEDGFVKGRPWLIRRGPRHREIGY